MSRLFLFLFFFATLFSLQAQSSYFNVTETESFKDVSGLGEIIGMHQMENGDTFIVRQAKKKALVNIFDSAYSLQNTIEIDINKKESVLGTVLNGDKVFIFTSDKVDKRIVDVYAAIYESGASTITKKKLYTQNTGKRKGVSWLGAYFALDIKKYDENFRLSPNGRYIAFGLNNINKKTLTSSFRVYDTDLNEVYTNTFIEDTESIFQFDDFVVTDDAVVIAAGKKYLKGWADKKKNKANYEYVLYKVTSDTHSQNSVDLGDNYVKQARFAQTDAGLKLLGFYSERNSSRMKGGISYTLSDEDIADVNVKTSPFPKQVFADLYPAKKAERSKKKEKELRTYEMDYILQDDLGNSYITAEQFYITTQTAGGGINGVAVTTTVFHYDDILILKFDPKGNILWGRSILKKANSPSYQPIVVGDKLHVLLNTGKNITDKSNDRKKLKKSWLEKSALYDIVYDENGNESYEMIKENGNRKRFFSPWVGYFDWDTFVMPNFSKKKKQFLILRSK